MNKNLLKYIAFYTIAILLGSCQNGEEKLLEPKVYFENKEFRIEVGDGLDSLTYDLQARLSSMCSLPVGVEYEIAGEDAVKAYNTKNGTYYDAFDVANVSLSSQVTVIPQGDYYAEKTILQLSKLASVEEGKPFLLPVRIKSSTLPIIEGTDIVYLIISKPVRIMKACKFASNYIKVPVLPAKPFSSITYEALIYINGLNSNNTIMGTEGILVFRIGDLALPGGHNDWIQIAGNKQYHSTETFGTGKWYHVAFTYDQPTGKTVIYINGKKSAESNWDTPSFDLSTASGGFFIGKIANFMWGERPFYGYMSEVRVWSLARSENQIKQNMLSADPTSDGLFAYYKLNGKDQFQENGTWYIKDASGNEMNGLANGGHNALNFTDLDEPVAVK